MVSLLYANATKSPAWSFVAAVLDESACRPQGPDSLMASIASGLKYLHFNEDMPRIIGNICRGSVAGVKVCDREAARTRGLDSGPASVT
jgi:hypothetical protein